MVILLFSSVNSYANEFDFGLSYSHLRAESSQTGIPSEFLFKPALKASLDYTFNLTETQILSVGAEYAMHKVDTANVTLHLGEDDFMPFNYHLRYAKWTRQGLNFIVMAGQKEYPIYTIANLTVDFEKFTPYYYAAGIAFRAKNALGTLEAEYLYKYIPKTDLGSENWQGYAQEIKMHFNFGRKKNLSAKKPGLFGRVNFIHYKRSALEGIYGMYFNYNFSRIKSNTNYDYQLDERVFGIYYKWRITNPYRRN